jgi:CII-binding regulator of phage lambda lysogenization HflD
MTDIEKTIIDLIEGNPHLSTDLKKRYILALFLMEREEQEEYLKLIQAFTYRCNAVERGIYIVKAEEREMVMKTLEEVKEDILRKINTNNN